MLGESDSYTNPIEWFVEAAGTYRGRGTRGDGEEFVGELTIEPAVEGAGAMLHFEARGDAPRPLHEDHMLIGMTRGGSLYLWGLDSSTERIRKHELRETGQSDGAERFTFGIGRPDNQSVFREQITFGFAGDRVMVEYAAAKPGESLDEPSRIELVPEGQFSLSERSETTEITYREFTARPPGEVVECVESLYEQVFGSDRPADIRDDGLWSPEGTAHLNLARAEDHVVGFKIGYQRRPDQFYSWLGAVLPGFRRRGIATELLTRQHTWASEAGYSSIRTKTTNEWREMIILNLQHGFDIVGTEHDRHDELKIVLEKGLG